MRDFKCLLFKKGDLKSVATTPSKENSHTTYNPIKDTVTFNEMLSSELNRSRASGGLHQTLQSVSHLQNFQRPNCALSAKRLNRPASVPSTKKFEDCGVSCHKY